MQERHAFLRAHGWTRTAPFIAPDDEPPREEIEEQKAAQ